MQIGRKGIGEVKETWIVASEFNELLLRTIRRKVVNKIRLPVLIGLRQQHLNKRFNEKKSVVIWNDDINQGRSSIKRVSHVGCMKGPVFQFIGG